MIDPSPSDSFESGQILNHTYEIEGVLGRGGTGEVYRARNLVEDRPVAIKALRAEFARDPGFVDLMKREVRKMHGIVHDAVVRYIGGSFLESGHVILVMEFVDGPSLGDVMLRRHLDPRELLVVAHRVAQGLVATHAEGIVHRDLSPDNIVLRDGDPGQAVIIDFGIAKDTRPGARTVVGDAFAGKYEYAPPEQLEGRTDPRSDLYALGASLLAAWRGEVPFRDVPPAELLRRKQSPLDTGDVREPLRGLIDWLSAPDPARRPGDAAAVVARVEAALDEMRPREKAPPKARRRRWLWAALPASALAAAAAAWGVGWIGGPPVADPWVLGAAYGFEDGARLEGHVPDRETAEALLRAFEEATGGEPETNLVRASGMPTPLWPAQVADLLGTLAAVERWDVGLQGTEGHVEALAPDVAGRDALEQALDRWSNETSIALTHEVAAGPEWLSAAEVQGVLDRDATCGRLVQEAPPDHLYPLGGTIVVSGSLIEPDDARRIEASLGPTIGSRDVELNATALGPSVCRARNALPPELFGDEHAGVLSIWLGYGETGQANPSGVFRQGQNPVLDVLAPAEAEGSLLVALVNTNDDVFNVLPTPRRPETNLRELGEVAAGVRRVPVLHSRETSRADRSLLDPMVINDKSFGKVEVLALLTRTPLFDVALPTGSRETGGLRIDAFAEQVTTALRDRPDEILGVATRIIDARQ